VALNQGPISFDSAAPVSEQQADAVNQRLGRGSGISVAILPDDPQFSAVGAARELEFHLNRPGTIITLLGNNVGATSTDIDGHVLGTLVRQSQQVYDREGTAGADWADRRHRAVRRTGGQRRGRGWASCSTGAALWPARRAP
jgi:hypothetical protein